MDDLLPCNHISRNNLNLEKRLDEWMTNLKPVLLNDSGAMKTIAQANR